MSEPVVPTVAEVSRAILPGARIAVREHYRHNLVKRMLFTSFLPVIIIIVLQLGLDFILNLLRKWGWPIPDFLKQVATTWERDRTPEVRVALARVAAGDTGEDE